MSKYQDYCVWTPEVRSGFILIDHGDTNFARQVSTNQEVQKIRFTKERMSHSTLPKVHFSGGGSNVGSSPCGPLDGDSFLVED